MLRSTYKPQSEQATPLPPGWTEHKAPSGHSYYYNASTKESSYKRPVPEAPPPTAHGSAHPYQELPSLADPAVANAYLAQVNASQRPPQTQERRPQDRPRPQPVDKPVSRADIPGCAPWVLVNTKYGRRFAYNPEKNASFWRIPEKLKKGILEMDTERLRRKAEGADDKTSTEKNPAVAPDRPHDDGDSSEYEEVEVTDDEEEDEHGRKRQRMDGAGQQGPVEFSEADIVFQLQAMGEEYGLDQGEYYDGNDEEWEDGAEGVQLSDEDAKSLFKNLLDDFRISPYSPWERLVEEGKIFDDPRYTVLTTMKARREAWDEWSQDKIREQKEKRAREDKKDPTIAYLAFLAEKATPKLYWPEFKRKYRKENPMKDLSLADKERERLYREHVNRLKLPQATLKSDLTALLKVQPLSALNNRTQASHLPVAVVKDARYISLDAKVRDPIIEAYIQSLPPPPEGPEEEETEEARKQKQARDRRSKALQERNREIEEREKRSRRDLEMSKMNLRDSQREVEQAMKVSKRGLLGQLAQLRTDDKPE